MVTENPNIAILSTVINFDLYAKSSVFFPQNIQKYIIDGRNGMHGLSSILYMMKKLKNKNVEWLIMADEDVLFFDNNIIFDIIDKMKTDDYMVSGIRDGGMISHRLYNPYLINTFFSIINFKELERIWNKNEILKNNYIIDNEFSDDITNLQESYDSKSLFEPYYCFYLWLRRKNKKFLFLNANMYQDTYTNSVEFNNKLFLYHTWFARAYGINEKHTIRINKIFDILNMSESNKSKFSEPIIFKDYTYFLVRKIKKNCTRIIKRFKN